jgi:hypothetical protein
MHSPTLDPPAGARHLTDLVGRVVRIAAFWLAVVLPFTYLPLFLSLDHLPIADTGLVVAGLFTLNVACLVVGRHYNSE